MADKKELEKKAIVVYRLEDRPPFLETLLLGLQHMLAMFVGIITPPRAGGSYGSDVRPGGHLWYSNY